MKISKEFLKRNAPLAILGVVVIGLLTSCHAESSKTLELQTIFRNALSESTETCLDNYGQYKDTIVNNVDKSQSDLLSEHYYLREPAIKTLAWQFIAPNGDATLYKTYFQKIANINPNMSFLETENNGYFPYLITLEKATKIKPGDFANPKRLAEALCEATFRTYKLIENPNSDEWAQDTLTFSAIKAQMPGVVFDSKTGKFRTVTKGDTPDIITNQYKIDIAKH